MDPKPSHNLRQREQEELTGQQQEQTKSERTREFATPEELLRHDAAQTNVPPAIEERLQQSVAAEQKPKSWWQRLFGKS